MPKIPIAKILRPHGIQGSLILKIFCEEPEKFEQYAPFCTEGGDEVSVRVQKFLDQDRCMCRLKDCTDRTQAEALRGQMLYIQRDQLPPTEQDDFYVCDLVGLSVMDQEIDQEADALLGKVRRVEDHGAGVFLEIQPEKKFQQKNSWTLPFSHEAISEIDIEKGRIVIHREFLL